MAEVQIERSRLIEEARAALRQIEIAEEIIDRLQGVIDGECHSVHSARGRLRAILKHAGADVPSDPGDWESAARRFVDEAGDG